MAKKSEILKSKSTQTGKGGARPGAGRPKGKKSPKTLEREEVLRQYRERVSLHVDKIFNSQLDLAVGEKVLMVKYKERDSKGKVTRTWFEQVKDPEKIKEYLDFNEGMDNGVDDPSDEDEFYFMTTKPANNGAIESLMNRTFGKVTDNVKTEVTGSLAVKVINYADADTPE